MGKVGVRGGNMGEVGAGSPAKLKGLKKYINSIWRKKRLRYSKDIKYLKKSPIIYEICLWSRTTGSNSMNELLTRLKFFIFYF